MSTDSTIVLITGANTGIGYEAVKALLRSEREYTILLGGSDVSKAEAATKTVQDEVKSSAGSTISPLQIDVTDDTSITTAFETVKAEHDHIDILINNAGASFDSKILSKELTVREAWNKAWDTNVTGAHIVTETFLPLLLRSSAPRLLFNTSGLSSLEDASNPKNPFYKEAPAGLPKPFSPIAYQCSKTGLNMLIVNWTRLTKHDGVKVFGVAPGFLATGLGGNPEILKKAGAGDPSRGGAALVAVVEGKHDDNAGRVVREYGDSSVQNW